MKKPSTGKPWSFVAILIAFLVASSAVGTLPVGAQSVVRVIVDGRGVGLNPPAVIHGGRVIVPLRGVFEAMGATVSYLAPRTILITRDAHVIELELGRRVARVDNAQVMLDTPPITISGYARVPLRFVAEALGATVSFNRSARIVEIFTTPEAGGFPAPEPDPQPEPIPQPQPAPYPQPSPFPSPYPQPSPFPQPPFPQPQPTPPFPPADTQPFPTSRPSRPTVVFPLPGASVGNPVSVQGTASGASRVRVTVSVPVVGIPIGSGEATVLPFVGLFSANVSYPGLFRGLPLTITVIGIDSVGTESEPFTVIVRQG